MIRRFIAWLRSLFSSPREAIVVPSKKEKPKGFVPFLHMVAHDRAELRKDRRRFLKAKHEKAPHPTATQKCICGCGTEHKVPYGTLQFFAGRKHRNNYRRSYGSSYGKVKL